MLIPIPIASVATKKSIEGVDAFKRRVKRHPNTITGDLRIGGGTHQGPGVERMAGKLVGHAQGIDGTRERNERKSLHQQKAYMLGFLARCAYLNIAAHSPSGDCTAIYLTF